MSAMMLADSWTGINGWWLAGPAIGFVVVMVAGGSSHLGRLIERARLWFRSQ